MQSSHVAHVAERKQRDVHVAIYDTVLLVTNQKIEKLRLLPDRYKIDPKSDTLWLFICFRLAEEFVPGFKVVLHAPKGPGAPRKSYIDLVQAVEFLVAVGTRTGERISVLGACKKLSSQRGPWYEKGPKTLETRYYECRAKLAQHRGIVETDLIRRLERAAKAAMA